MRCCTRDTRLQGRRMAKESLTHSPLIPSCPLTLENIEFIGNGEKERMRGGRDIRTRRHETPLLHLCLVSRIERKEMAFLLLPETIFWGSGQREVCAGMRAKIRSSRNNYASGHRETRRRELGEGLEFTGPEGKVRETEKCANYTRDTRHDSLTEKRRQMSGHLMSWTHDTRDLRALSAIPSACRICSSHSLWSRFKPQLAFHQLLSFSPVSVRDPSQRCRWRNMTTRRRRRS